MLDFGAGILGLLASALTLIHAKLKCDEYQAECRALQSKFESLAVKFSNLKIIEDKVELQAEFKKVNKDYTETISRIKAAPSTKSMRKAKQRI